jgi:serine/threonine-protein kinase
MTTTTTTEFVPVGTGEALFEVPDLKQQVFADVKTQKLAGEMTVKVVGYEFNGTIARGSIVQQSPAAGEKIARGSVISVVLSAGSATGTMPDVTGWKEEHAKLYLEALGYKVEESLPLQVSTFDKGLIEKTSPKAGSEISVGDAITLYVSNVEQVQDVGNADVLPEQ